MGHLWDIDIGGWFWWVVLVLVNRLKLILVFKLYKQYMIGLTQEPFDTNDDGQSEI